MGEPNYRFVGGLEDSPPLVDLSALSRRIIKEELWRVERQWCAAWEGLLPNHLRPRLHVRTMRAEDVGGRSDE